MASNSHFIQIENIRTAGIGVTDALPLFRRQSFIELSEFCDRIIAQGGIGLIDGLPGTGKSSTVWHIVLSFAKSSKQSAIWFHFNRCGGITSIACVHSNGECVSLQVPDYNDIKPLLYESNEDLLVFDGCNHNIFNVCLIMMQTWQRKREGRVGFIAMSNKIKREHPHELMALRSCGMHQEYITQHSWTLEEYLTALVQEDGSPSELMIAHLATFEKDWEIDYNNVETENNRRVKRCKLDLSERKPVASVKQIITQKYFYAGGSIRWMLTQSIQEIESLIRRYLKEVEYVDELLKFHVGPIASIAKTHLYSSVQGADDEDTHYKLISERATQLLVEKVGRSSIKALYSHVTKIMNPAFLGWVLEADYFSRCNENNLRLIRSDGTSFDMRRSMVLPVVDIDVELMDDFSNLDCKGELKAYLSKFIPQDNSVTVCKPIRWNQGGYDVVRIQITRVFHPFTQFIEYWNRTSKIRIDLLFGQVTKSDTHSLKLNYFENLANMFVAADYEIGSIEIGFIVPEAQVKTFSIPSSAVTSSGRLSHHTVYGTSEKWTNKYEHQQVAVYGLSMDAVNFPTL